MYKEKINSLPSLISKANKSIKNMLIEELKKAGAEELSPSHGYILIGLYKNEKMSMTEITKTIGKKKNTVTMLVKKLIDYNYIQKHLDPKDSRKTYIVLTKKGREFHSKFDKISKNLIDTTIKGFTEEEKELFVVLIEKIINNFKEV